MQDTAHIDDLAAALQARAQKRRATPPYTVIAVVAAIVACVGYLAFTALSTSTVYYLTVSELRAKGPGALDQPVRVGGRLADGSLHRDSSGRIDSFSLTDGTGTIPVVFQGDAPDLFGYAKDGLYQDAVVEGKLDAKGTFAASQIIVKHDANFQASDGSRPPTSAPSGTFPAKRG